jgi:hypothetical protein
MTTAEQQLKGLLYTTGALCRALKIDATIAVTDDRGAPGIEARNWGIGAYRISYTHPSIRGPVEGPGWQVYAIYRDLGTRDDPPTEDLDELYRTSSPFEASRQIVLAIVNTIIDGVLEGQEEQNNP